MSTENVQVSPSGAAARISQVEAIRAEIAELRGQLSAIAGEGLLISSDAGSDWEDYNDQPAGGATLRERSPISGQNQLVWYPSVEAARAALLELCLIAGTVPSEDGWRGSVGVNDMFITRYDDVAKLEVGND